MQDSIEQALKSKVASPYEETFESFEMVEPIVVGILAFVGAVIYASFAEWVIHRHLMHRTFLGFQHFYNGHAKVHHGKYQADASYLVGERPRVDLTFAVWAMPFPVLFHAPYLIPLGIWVSLPAALAITAAFSLYQAAYESLHYCMHVREGRWFERTWAFQWINNHHFEHHRKHGTNLNVILPIADFVLRTRRRPVAPAPVGAVPVGVVAA